jgi:hypothetical protein
MDSESRGTAARLLHGGAVWGIAMLLAIAMTWPLATGLDRLGRTENSGDARFTVWNVAWVAHALTTSPSSVYDANIFHPHRRTLAYSETNLGAGVLAIPAWWLTRNPFIAHNVVVLFAFASSVVTVWYLTRRLTGDPFGAAAASVVYAFCPYLFSHTAHIQLLMAAGLPLSMLAFHRVVDAPSAGRGLQLGLALSATAHSCAYYGIFAALMVGYATVFSAWWRGLWRSPRYWTAIATGAAVSLGLVVPFFLPYLAIQGETGFTRTLDDARMYAATWRSYLASSAAAHRWMLTLIRDWGGEVLFPGFAAVLLAGYGAVAVWRRRAVSGAVGPARDREMALLYGSALVLSFWATLGPRAGLYTVFYKAIPVFSFLRAPGRMGLVVMLCLAVLAAYGLRALRGHFGARAALVGALTVAAALIELAQIPFPWREAAPISRSYDVLTNAPRGSLAEFPFYERRIDYYIHTRYMLNSTRHWMPLVNGYSDHIPLDFRPLAVRLASFPSRDAFQALRERRVRYIAIHRDRYGAEAASDVERRLQEFQPHLKLLADDSVVLVYEVTSWPP